MDYTKAPIDDVIKRINELYKMEIYYEKRGYIFC